MDIMRPLGKESLESGLGCMVVRFRKKKKKANRKIRIPN